VGAAGESSSSTPASTTPSASSPASEVSSATPPGSVPTFTVAGCATSQAEVASTLERLRLVDGVGEVVLQSSSKSGGGGSSGGCRLQEPAFAVQVTFDALPAPTGTPAPLSPTSSTGSSSSSGQGALK
jgi:hypothetical protein